MSEEIFTEWIKGASVFLFVAVLVIVFLLLVRWLIQNAGSPEISEAPLKRAEKVQKRPQKGKGKKKVTKKTV